MAGLIDAMKQVYPSAMGGHAEKEAINAELKELLPKTAGLIGSYIRCHPNEFAVLTD
jgi:hypothetical protein